MKKIIVLFLAIGIIVLLSIALYYNSISYKIDEDQTITYIKINTPMDTLKKKLNEKAKCPAKLPIHFVKMTHEISLKENQYILYYNSEIEEMYLITVYISPQITSLYCPTIDNKSWLTNSSISSEHQERITKRFERTIKYFIESRTSCN